MLTFSYKVSCAIAAGMMLLGGSIARPGASESSNGAEYPGAKGLKYLFSFGDSYTRTGFNMTNGSPLPTSGNPMGNPPYTGWMSANGPTWINYLTFEFNKTEVLTFNMAYGGATIDTALVKPWSPAVLSMKQQVEDLFLGVIQPQKSSIAPWKSNNSLFLFWIGINDVARSHWSHPNDADGFHTKLMNEYFRQVDELYEAGARNFLFIDVPPIDRSPLTVGQGPQSMALLKEAITSYNGLLKERVRALTKQKPRVWAKVYESSKLYNKIWTKPKQYGFKNATEYCRAYESGTPEWDTYLSECGVPVDEYFWLNNLHPTHLVHKFTAEGIAKVL